MFNKKIVIAATEIGIGGIGSYLLDIAQGLKSRGWDVHLLITNVRRDLNEKLEEIITFHDLSKIPLSRNKIITASNLLNEIAPDILLLNNCSLIHYCLPLLTSHIKPVAVLHSDDPRFYATATMFSSRIFRWIAPTRGVARRLDSYLKNFFSDKIRTIAHGINPCLFVSDRRIAENSAGSICFIGYIAENKGADLLPEIMVRIARDRKDAHLTIVGYGPMVETLKKAFREKNLSNNCSFTGPLARAQVADLLISADILLSPTRIEGFGLSIIEAMMVGVVPVVSRLEGITDFIIDDGLTGMLVKPDDVDGFVNAVVKLLNDKMKLQTMSDAALKVASEKYSIDRMLDDYERLFEEKDDRGESHPRSSIGWYKETIAEVIKKGVDHKWFMKRAQELFK